MKIRKLSELTEREINGLHGTLDGYDDYFISEVAANVCELWEINDGESFCITRLERDTIKDTITLVVCAYKGKNLDQFAQHITKIADANKWLIRVHTTKPALVRWYTRKYNFNKPEYVLIRDNQNGK